MYLIKLAYRNMKSNKGIYRPFILAGIVSCIIFYVIAFIGMNKSVLESVSSVTFEKILKVGTAFSILIIFFFLYLANGYLLKNKKKIFGIWNTLGLSKNQIVVVTFWETLIFCIITIIIGEVIGTAVSFGLSYGVVDLLGVEETISITFSERVVKFTVIVFGLLYLAIFIINAYTIYNTKTIELIKGKQVGDKELHGAKTRSILGVAVLLIGYAICFFTRSPLSSFTMMILSAALIIYGIYTIFEYTSVNILKKMKNNDRVYYKTDNFICVSNLLYRIRKNAVGLATICVLSTAVIIILTTTISLYAGIQDQVSGMFVKDVMATVIDVNEEDKQAFAGYVDEIIEEHEISDENLYFFTHYSSMAKFDENMIDCDASANVLSPDFAYVIFVNVEDYNAVMGKNYVLGQDEVLLITNKKYNKETILLGEDEYKVTEVLPPERSIEGSGGQISTAFEIVCADERRCYQSAIMADENDERLGIIDINCYLDSKEEAVQNALVNEINHYINEQGFKGSCNGYRESFNFYLSFYAGALFIGIGLSILFIIMTGYIIYYKQVSDSFEDRDAFLMMEKIGLTHSEIKRSAGKQMVITFAAPVVFTAVNVMFVSKIVYKFMAILNMSNLTLFVGCIGISVLIYAVVYMALYVITTHIYTRNVSEKYSAI